MSKVRGKLQCSDDGVIAGVCRGLADRLNLDVGVLRFAFVSLSLVSAGLFVLVYVALWLLLPSCGRQNRAVEVVSDASDERPSAPRSFAELRKQHAEILNEPPVPPPLSKTEAADCARDTSSLATVGIAMGIMLMVVFVCVLLSGMFPVVSPIQLWPLLLVSAGIVRTVVLGVEGYRVETFFGGALLILVGVVLLPNTTGLVVLDLSLWLAQCWPLFVMSLGCIVLWRATMLNGFCVAALMLLAASCMVGFLFCASPGPAAGFLMRSPLPVIVGFGA